MRAIDTVLFDLDDTLHDDTTAYRAAARSVADALAREHGFDAQALAEAYEDEAMRFWSSLSAEHLSHPIGDVRERMWHAALREVGIDDAAQARRAAAGYVAARSDVLELAPGALDVLTALRARGCKLGLVTNGFAATHHDKIDRLGLRERMDAFFIADEVGMIKPDPALFRHACDVLGSAPERTAMVGDRYERDVRGAHAAGLFTVLLDVHGLPVPPGGPQPDAVVAFDRGRARGDSARERGAPATERLAAPLRFLPAKVRAAQDRPIRVPTTTSRVRAFDAREFFVERKEHAPCADFRPSSVRLFFRCPRAEAAGALAPRSSRIAGAE